MKVSKLWPLSELSLSILDVDCLDSGPEYRLSCHEILDHRELWLDP